MVDCFSYFLVIKLMVGHLILKQDKLSHFTMLDYYYSD